MRESVIQDTEGSVHNQRPPSGYIHALKGAFFIITNDAGHQAGGFGGQAVDGKLFGFIIEYNTGRVDHG